MSVDEKSGQAPLSAVKSLFEARKNKSPAEGEGSILLTAALSVVENLRPGKIAAHEGPDRITVYKIDEQNVVNPLSDLQLERAVFNNFPSFKKKERREIVDFLKLSTVQTAPLSVAAVSSVAFADELDKLTWSRLKLKASDLGDVSLADLKAFNHILSLCDDPRAVALWIGSILDPLSSRTQYLHLHGGGGNGKSRLFEVLGQVLGSRSTLTGDATIFSDAHFGEELEGKRLLLLPDENNPGFCSSGRFKTLTGEPYIDVNPKFEKRKRIWLTHKTVICSNNKVEISTQTADRRRLLSVSMQEDPGENILHRWWYKELADTAEQIIAYCYHTYMQAVAEDETVRSGIIANPVSLEAAIDRKYAELTDIIVLKYELTGNEQNTIARATLHSEVLKEFGERRSNRIFLQQMKEALTRLGVKEGAQHGGTRVYRGIKTRTNFDPLRTSRSV